MASQYDYSRGVKRLLADLDDHLTGTLSRVWLVPIEEHYSALVVGNVNKADFLRYVTNKVLERAVAVCAIEQGEVPETTPPVLVPDRMVVPRQGTVYYNTPLTSYKAYRLYWPMSQSLGYKLDLNQLGRDLKKFRAKHDWDMAQAARRAGVTRKTVLRLEAGGMPSGEALLRLLSMMNVKDYQTYMVMKEGA